MSSNIDNLEIEKFSQHAQHWWDRKGPLKTLHDINPVRLQFILDNCGLNKKNVLDLGCGGGILAEAMAVRGAKVTGVDASASAIEVAKAHAEENNVIIEYFCSSIEDFPERKFDVITCMEMLEHVPDPQSIITHCARLLSEDGYLFFSTINRTLKAYLSVILGAEYLLGLLPKQTHDFKKFIKPSELAAMVREAGLVCTHIIGLDYSPFTSTAKLEAKVEVNYLMSCRLLG